GVAGPCSVLLAGAVAGQQRSGGLDHLVSELALAGEQLLGEVVTAGHNVLRLRQLVGERHVHRGDPGGDRLNGVDHGLDRVEGHLLALADDREELVLQFLLGGGGAGHCLCLLLASAANFTKQRLACQAVVLDLICGCQCWCWRWCVSWCRWPSARAGWQPASGRSWARRPWVRRAWQSRASGPGSCARQASRPWRAWARRSWARQPSARQASGLRASGPLGR